MIIIIKGRFCYKNEVLSRTGKKTARQNGPSFESFKYRAQKPTRGASPLSSPGVMERISTS